ncbi:cysteine-rich receptor-like protein kinase 8 [Tanacetum coccineum]|uniref:Cysteine-rich receptor-like protein kinase 8 n=1 Tax=Tanacetum coccineum TaxID=301880 RepID=A0ABQ5FLG2_9ASTR
MGLDECYTNIKGQILLMQPLATAAKAYNMLRQEEKQRDTHKQSINAPITLNSYRTPYNTSNNSSHRNNTTNPNTPSNNNQSDRRSTFRKGIICTYCKKEGHSKEECYKLLGYPVGHPLHKKYLPPSHRTQGNGRNRTVNMVMGESSNSQQQESPQTTPLEPLPIPDETHVYARMDQLQNQLNQVILMMQTNQSDPTGNYMAPHVAGIISFSPKAKVPSSLLGIHSLKTRANIYSFIASNLSNTLYIWIVDSGATDHICITLTQMHNTIKLTHPISVSLPNGTTVEANITGSVKLNDSLTLHNVFYIPTFTYNLISISQLLKRTTKSVTFTADKFIFQDHDGYNTHGILHGGLYILPTVSLPSKPHQPTIQSHSSTQHLWHARLGHTSLPVIQKIKDIPLPVLSNSVNKCHVCPLAKQHVLPFPVSNAHAKSKFELVHFDVWGPYKHPTINKCTHFLTIVDDFSRATWTYLLPNKHHVFSTFQTFITYVKTQYNAQIKQIRSDNGTEFINSSFKTFTQQHGIIHQTSCPYTPQQNARVERKHRHLLEMARAIQFQAQFPLHF